MVVLLIMTPEVLEEMVVAAKERVTLHPQKQELPTQEVVAVVVQALVHPLLKPVVRELSGLGIIPLSAD